MLSKSDLQSYLQCRRKLWLEHHRPELAAPDSLSSRRRETEGNLVGEIARQQLGARVVWPPALDNQIDAAEGAKSQLADSPDLSAVEAPMFHAGLYARADALVRRPGGYVLRETKASSFPLKPDKVRPNPPKPHHLDDIAIQVWVMRESGLPMVGAELNLLDSRWRYPGGGDYSGLFRQYDVADKIVDRCAAVPAWLQAAEDVLDGAMPDAQTGKHCADPHDCAFKAYCLGLDPPAEDHPIELLPDTAGKALAKRLREANGYTSILQPAPDELVGAQAPLFRRIQSAHRSGQAVLLPAAATIMQGLPYPRYFFDFEGIDLAVPRWVGVRPYEQIPFQWSCHIERAPGVFDHAEFLDLSGEDPSVPCIERMREVIDPDDEGPILVYFANYERGRLEEIAERHPLHAELVQKYVARLVDLLPIVRDNFYHPAMRGSFSIKKVLPVVAPDLNYAELEGVQEGTGAQIAYLEAAFDSRVTVRRRAEIDQQLRTYCRQDTWAMVEIAHFLAAGSRPERPAGI